MTDRIRTLTVVLDKDYREDDVQVFVETIKMIKGVGKVTLGPTTGAHDAIARMTLATEVETRLHEAIESVFKQNRIRKMAQE